MLIFLVGFMGSGKTTIGREVAKALDLDFWDMDDLIQDQQGMTIQDIFQQHGQDHFRILERELIKELSTSITSDAVISTGGGAPCFFDNMEQINKLGTSVYLQMNPKQLFDRLKDQAAGRPLIAGKSDEEMLELIDLMYQQRAAFYEKALYTVDGNETPEIITEHILYLLNEVYSQSFNRSNI